MYATLIREFLVRCNERKTRFLKSSLVFRRNRKGGHDVTSDALAICAQGIWGEVFLKVIFEVNISEKEWSVILDL